MYQIWQYPVFVLHDLLALTCMTVTLSAVRGFYERKRSITVCVYALTTAAAAVNIACLPAVTAATDYDTGFLVYGGAALVAMLVFPQIILRTTKRLSSALICLALNTGMEGLFSVIGYMLRGVDHYSYHFYETLFCSLGYAAISAFFIYTSKNKDLKIIRSTVELIPKWLYVIIILCSFASFFTLMGEAPGVYNFETVMGIMQALAVFGVILFAGYFVVKVFALMAKQNQFLTQMNAQQQNYEQMLMSDEQLRQFRHDYKNHMIVVTSLLNAGLMDDAKEYLDKIKGDSGIAENRFRTGNIVVDAILNSKLDLAEAFGIELSFSGAAPEQGIEHADLCTVVGNTVDNAIEGAKRCTGKRYVNVRFTVRNGFLTITTENPVSEKVIIKNNRIKTTKSDTKNHGIGLKNVAATAKKYGGGMALSCSETEFTSDVTMRLQENR